MLVAFFRNTVKGGTMNKRVNKGKSLFVVPDEYTIIDIETTGLSPAYDSIIEVAAIKYKSGKEIKRFSSLVQPEPQCDGTYVSEFIERLTGIKNEMLISAPTAAEVLPQYYAFLSDSIIIGHNVNFDINFLYDNFEHYLDKSLSNDFVDTMRISRNLHPEEPHHTLSDLKDKYSLKFSNAHRAMRDCDLTQAALIALYNDAVSIYGSYESFIEALKKKHKKQYLKSSDIRTEKTEFDHSHPLYNKVCVFTGALERMVRRDAMQLVVDLGGINSDSVTKKTNYLILGNNDYCKSIKGGKSSKQKKAEKLKLDGLDIEVLPEDVFYDMLDN